MGTHLNTDDPEHKRDNNENEDFHIAVLLLAVVEDVNDGKSHQHDARKSKEGGSD